MRFQTYDASPANITIYLDLDGVLTDFIFAANSVCIPNIRTDSDWQRVKKTEWPKIAKEGVDFWEHMPWMKDGKKLWNFVKDVGQDVRILSAYPQAPENVQPSLVGKSKWCTRELGISSDNIHLVAGRDKQRYAENKTILIDDSARNCKQFVQMGGKAIQHISTSNTIEQLKHIYGY